MTAAASWSGSAALLVAAMGSLAGVGMVGATAPARAEAQATGTSTATSATATDRAGPLERGRALLAKGDWAGALLVLRPALSNGEADPALRSALARAYSEIGEDAPAGSAAQKANFEQALAHARREVELAPDSPQAHLDVAIAQGKIARVSGAKTKLKLAPVVAEEARRTLELDPENWQAHYVLGVWNREIATLGGLKKLGASLMGGLPKASLAEAIANLEMARRLAPSSIRTRLDLGRTYLEADRDDAARAELQAAIDLPPSDPRDPGLRREARAELAELR